MAGTPLAEASVLVTLDASKVPGLAKAAGETAGRNLQTGITTAGRSAGTAAGKAMVPGVTAGAKASAVSADRALLAGALTSGTGYGRRFGTAMKGTVLDYAKGTGAALLGFFAFEKAKELVGEVVQQGEDAKRGLQLTAAAIASTGGEAGITADHITELTKSLGEQVGVDDDTVRGIDNLLLRFTSLRNEVGKGNDVYDRATASALDLAGALKIDATSAATTLGRALNDPSQGLTLLTRRGVQFTDQQKNQIAKLQANNDLLGAQRIILDELEKRYGGAAEASKTMGDKAGAAFQNMEQELGLKLLPLIDDVQTFFATDGIDALRSFGSGIDTYAIPPLKGLVSAGGDVIGMFDDLPGGVKSSIVEVGLLAVGIRALTPLFEAAGKSAQSGLTMTRVVASETADQIAATERSVAGFAKTAGSLGKQLFLSKTGALGAAVGLQVLDSAVGDTDKGMHELLTVGSDVALGFAVGGPWGAALGAGVGILQLFGEAHKQAAEDAKAFQDTLDETTGAVTRETATLLANKAASSGLADATGTLGISQREVFDAILQGGSAADQYKTKLLDLAAAHTTVTKRGKEYFTSVDATGQAANQAAGFIDDMSGSLESGTDAWRTHKAANDAANAALRGTKTDAAGASAAIKAAKAQVVTLDQALQNLNATLSKRSSLRDYKAALDAADKALKDNGKTLNNNTEKGRANAAALDDIAAKAVAHAQAMRDDFKATGDLNDNLAHQRDFLDRARQSLIDQAVQFGKTKAQAKSYADQILEIPPTKKTQLQLIADKALADARAFKQLLDNLHDKTVTLTFQRHGFIDPGAAGGATGGQVRGGIPGRDSVHALLEPGEVVLRKKAVDAIGMDNALRINAMGYAAGGQVGRIPAVPRTPIPAGASDKDKARIQADNAVVVALNHIRFGLRQDAGAVHDEFAALIQATRKALGKDSPLVGRLADVAADAVIAARDRAAVPADLSKAVSKLTGLQQAQRQLSTGAAQAFTSNPFEAAHTTQGLLAASKYALTRVRRFLAAEKKLIARGLDPALIAQLVGTGPDAVDAAVALANAPKSVFRQFERLNRLERRAAGQVGSRAGEAVFGDRVDSQQAVVDELRKERDQITHQLKQLVALTRRLLEHGGPNTPIHVHASGRQQGLLAGRAFRAELRKINARAGR